MPIPSDWRRDRTAIRDLHDHVLVNQAVTKGPDPGEPGRPRVPRQPAGSVQAQQQPPHPERITSSSGLQLDHVLPSANLNAVASGVFWAGQLRAWLPPGV